MADPRQNLNVAGGLWQTGIGAPSKQISESERTRMGASLSRRQTGGAKAAGDPGVPKPATIPVQQAMIFPNAPMRMRPGMGASGTGVGSGTVAGRMGGGQLVWPSTPVGGGGGALQLAHLAPVKGVPLAYLPNALGGMANSLAAADQALATGPLPDEDREREVDYYSTGRSGSAETLFGVPEPTRESDGWDLGTTVGHGLRQDTGGRTPPVVGGQGGCACTIVLALLTSPDYSAATALGMTVPELATLIALGLLRRQAFNRKEAARTRLSDRLRRIANAHMNRTEPLVQAGWMTRAQQLYKLRIAFKNAEREFWEQYVNSMPEPLSLGHQRKHNELSTYMLVATYPCFCDATITLYRAEGGGQPKLDYPVRNADEPLRFALGGGQCCLAIVDSPTVVASTQTFHAYAEAHAPGCTSAVAELHFSIDQNGSVIR